MSEQSPRKKKILSKEEFEWRHSKIRDKIERIGKVSEISEPTYQLNFFIPPRYSCHHFLLIYSYEVYVQDS